MNFATLSVAAAQTDTVMVAAPGAGKKVVVQQIFVSSDTAQKVMLESSIATEIWAQYVGANGGAVVPYSSPRGWAECALNESLTFTSAAAGNVFFSVGYVVM